MKDKCLMYLILAFIIMPVTMVLSSQPSPVAVILSLILYALAWAGFFSNLPS